MNETPSHPLDLAAPPDRRASLRRVVEWLILVSCMGMAFCGVWVFANRESPAVVQERMRQAFPGQSRALLDGASEITLYSLKSGNPQESYHLAPTSRPGQFHGYPIMGQVVLRSEEKTSLLAAMDKGFAQSRIFRAACFQPHHGLRAVQGGQSVDVVICFGCTTVETFAGKERGSAPLGRAPEAYFNRVLEAANVPLAPEYKP